MSNSKLLLNNVKELHSVKKRVEQIKYFKSEIMKKFSFIKNTWCV